MANVLKEYYGFFCLILVEGEGVRYRRQILFLIIIEFDQYN